MFLRAVSFEAQTPSTHRAVDSVVRQLRSLPMGPPVSGAGGQGAQVPGGAVVFAFGALAAALRPLAEQLRQRCPGLPVLVAGGSGAFSERGDAAGPSGATGLVWTGGATRLDAIDVGSDEFPQHLRSLLGDGFPSAMTLLFVRPKGYGPNAIQQLGRMHLGRHLLGGGTVGDPGVLAITATGEIVEGRAIAMRCQGLGLPQLQTTHSCRLLSDLRPITEVRGALVLRVDGEPALDLLARLGKQLQGQPLLQVVLAPNAPPGQQPAEDWLIRGIQGVDPEQRGLMLSEVPELGQRMGFAVQDAAAAKAHFRSSCRQIRQQLAGASPLCGLYVRSAQRGRCLYGRDHVDARLFTEQFRNTPMAGIQTPYEITPAGNSGSFQVFSGVLALLSAPS